MNKINSLSQFFILIFLIPLTLIFTGCGGAPAAPEIVIGIACPITGNSALMGDMLKKGVELAVHEVNSKGGLHGSKIVLKVGDDQSLPKEASTIAQNFSSNPKIMAVVGHFNSSCSLAGATIYNKNKLTQISPASTSPRYSQAGDYSFRTCFEDIFQGRYLASFAVKKLQKKKIAILFDNDDYGQGLKENFSKKAGELGAEVILAEAYTRPTTDFKPQLIKMKEQNPDLLFISGLYNEGALICSQLKSLGMDITVLGGDGLLGSDFINLGGTNVEGVYLTFLFSHLNPDPMVQNFVKSFKALHGSVPDAWAALSYDAAQIALEGIKSNPQVTRDSVYQYVKSVGNGKPGYQGVTGITAFDNQGDCQKSILMGTVESGQFVMSKEQLSIDEMGEM